MRSRLGEMSGSTEDIRRSGDLREGQVKGFQRQPGYSHEAESEASTHGPLLLITMARPVCRAQQWGQGINTSLYIHILLVLQTSVYDEICFL